ncbi:zinc finger lsd1 subclass family protein (macronuclear) [Tetrahymena thermophila SB210]|uniref:Zinc finger lsd1 subclass family protein n=1 Tax=Tetrahymena thermophila (strain SB210) TaxID=312017 RepID=I7LW46_TETTS|nr:zinc finger lsd1 subclass family protein [Tetrahymena thermophila SB210]EAS00824.2 zinc finger lsd1 subclass family protein [Tetrahymena thermophila SB210]|eukprot:XP_001021069.2 zinc finger lsd1 subclass family protein [Tetrahymena thermophila SB210]
MTASSIQGWPSLTIKCTSLDYVNRNKQLMYGIIDKMNNQNIQKTYTITQPHSSLSVRVNIYTIRNFAASDNIQVFMDGTMQGQYQKAANQNLGKILCLTKYDYLYQFYKNITHSANTFTLAFQSSISTYASTGGFALSELYIEIDTCYPGCQTCSGPANNQCLTCITGAVANNGQCQCTTGFAYQTSCVPTCPSGSRGEPTLLICVQDYCDASVCATCDNTTKSCTSCKSGFYLLYNQCVATCPTYTIKQGNVCQDILPSNGMYLLKALFQTFVSESEIAAGGLTVTGLEGNGYGTVTSSGAYTSVCNGVYYIGGYMLAASNASFKRTFTQLPPHSQIRVGFTFVAIDNWDKEYIYINYDGQQASNFMVNEAITIDKLCGLEKFMDLVFYVDKTAIHTSPTLNLEIKATLSLNSSQKSYGLRNLFVILIQCSQWCISCNPTACLQCDITHYLYKGSCYVTCPTTTYIDQNRECHDCDASCATCGGPNNTDCITCPPGKLLYNNGGWTCVSNCPATNYYSDGTKCQKCDSSCLTCFGGSNNNCQTCNAGVFLYQNQCLASCPSNTFVSGNPQTMICKQCLKCDAGCLTCKGPLSTNCLACQTGKYLFQDNSCQTCNPKCQSCKGNQPTDCLTCPSGKYMFADNSCNNCDTLNRFYIDGLKCLQCNPQCYNCQGPLPTNCLTYPKGEYLFADNSCQNCNTKNGFFISGMKCLKCNALCQSCKGPLPTDCLTCPLGKYLQSDRSCQDCDTFNGYFIDGIKCNKCFGKCSSCSGPLPNDCLTCPVGKFLLPDYSCQYCNTQDGFFIRNTKCIPCNPGCKTCKGSLITDCLTCPDQKYLFTDNTCRTCLTSKGYFKKNIQCLPCDQTCQTCFGENKNQCLSCTENSQLFQSFCEQQYDTYHSNYFSNQKIEQTQQYFQTGGQISFASSITSSIILSMISSSSFSLVATGLNSQKVSYHILINTKLPAQISKVFIEFKSSFPSMQYKYLNAYESILDQSDTQFQDSRYKLVNLSFNILQSCGHTLFVFGICLFVFISFYLLVEKLNDQNTIQQKSKIVYQRLISNIIIQFCQLVITMLVVGVKQNQKERL